MTASAKGTIEKPGKNIRQKAGLNKGILTSAWGQADVFIKYKSFREGKLCIKVPPHYSSQECAVCHYVHKDNRLSQADFICQRCQNQDNADINAASVIAQKGIALVLSEGFEIKKKIKVGKFGGKVDKTTEVGTGRAEPIVETQSTLVEIPVRRNGSDIVTQGSFSKGINSLRDVKRETPTTTSGSPCGTRPTFRPLVVGEFISHTNFFT